MDREGRNCFVSLGGASVWTVCQKAMLFKFTVQDLKW